MRLDEATIKELVHQLAASADQEPLGRRRDIRYRTSAQITVRPHGVIRPTPRSVELIDFSATGVAIIDQIAINPGARFIATLPGAHGHPHTVLCQAKQSRLNASGKFRISAAFADEEQTQRFVRGADGVVDESSIAPPRPNQPATIRSAAGTSDAIIRGFSQGIFEILSTQELRIGETFVLEIRRPERSQALRCSVSAIEAAPNDRYVLTATVHGPAGLGARSAGTSGWRAWFKRG